MKPYYEETRSGIRIYHGDCREVLQDLRPMADLLCTDPPYAAAATTSTSGFAKQKWGANWGDMSLVVFMAEATLNSPGALATEHQVIWFCDHLSYAALVPTFFRRYPLLQDVTWDKDMLGIGATFRKQTEKIIYTRTREAPGPSRSDLRDLVRLRPKYADKRHPNAKPPELIAVLTEPLVWSVLLDPFAGSGSALVAAKNMGRRAIGIEIEERYCEIAAERLSQEALFTHEATP